MKEYDKSDPTLIILTARNNVVFVVIVLPRSKCVRGEGCSKKYCRSTACNSIVYYSLPRAPRTRELTRRLAAIVYGRRSSSWTRTRKWVFLGGLVCRRTHAIDRRRILTQWKNVCRVVDFIFFRSQTSVRRKPTGFEYHVYLFFLFSQQQTIERHVKIVRITRKRFWNFVFCFFLSSDKKQLFPPAIIYCEIHQHRHSISNVVTSIL